MAGSANIRRQSKARHLRLTLLLRSMMESCSRVGLSSARRQRVAMKGVGWSEEPGMQASMDISSEVRLLHRSLTVLICFAWVRQQWESSMLRCSLSLKWVLQVWVLSLITSGKVSSSSISYFSSFSLQVFSIYRHFLHFLLSLGCMGHPFAAQTCCPIEARTDSVMEWNFCSLVMPDSYLTALFCCCCISLANLFQFLILNYYNPPNPPTRLYLPPSLSDTHALFRVCSPSKSLQIIELMGQTSPCFNESSTPKDVLTRELRLFRWRSESANNVYLPRVTFKRAYDYAQEQKYLQLVEKSGECVLQLARVRRELELVPKEEDGEVLLFQKYVCTLEEMRDALSLPEAIYCLMALLQGFEEIKKMFSSIVVTASCCFVTKEGEVRAWLHSNPKCNSFDPHTPHRVYGQREYNAIIVAVIDLVYAASNKQNSTIISFLTTMRETITKLGLRSDAFGWAKQFVNQFAERNQIEGVPLREGLKRMKEMQLGKRMNGWIAAQHLMSPVLIDNQQAKLTYSIRESLPVTARSPFVKAKSVSAQSQTLRQSETNTRASFIQSHSLNPSQQFFPQQFFPQQVSNVPPLDFTQFSDKKLESEGIKSARLSQMLEKTQKPVKEQRKTCVPAYTCIPSPDSPSLPKNTPSESLKISISNDSLSAGNILENSLTNIQASKKLLRVKLREKSSQQSIERKPKQVSITDLMENSEKDLEQTRKPEARFKSHNQMRSVQSIEESIKPSRPWITTKTITRLVVDSGSDSLVHSLGTESSSCVGSAYSGILTQLGRQVAAMERK